MLGGCARSGTTGTELRCTQRFSRPLRTTPGGHPSRLRRVLCAASAVRYSRDAWTCADTNHDTILRDGPGGAVMIVVEKRSAISVAEVNERATAPESRRSRLVSDPDQIGRKCLDRDEWDRRGNDWLSCLNLLNSLLESSRNLQ